MLNDLETAFYDRQLRLDAFGQARQIALKHARVLIVGVGGLGCPAALYLAAAGVGTIGLVDGDQVSLSNLHRQILFGHAAVGANKTEAAARRLAEANPFVQCRTYPAFGDADLLGEIACGYDLIIDGTDNYAAKYMIDEVAAASCRPLVYASISQFEGQLAVLHHAGPDGAAAVGYRDLFSEPPPAGFSQNCAEAGVLGVLPGLLGLMQANEAIKLLTGIGETLSGKLLTFDALSCEMRIFQIKPRIATAGQYRSIGIAGCALPSEEFPVISPPDFAQIADVVNLQLLDVRTAAERQVDSLAGIHIPLLELPRRTHELQREAKTVVYCQSGARSAKAQAYLLQECGFVEVLNLAGGLNAYRRYA